MGTFCYAARNMAGEMHEGELEAENLQEAAQILRAQHVFAVHLKKKEKRQDWKTFLQRQGNQKYAAFFCRQLSVMLDEQPVNAILSMLARQKGDREYQKLMQALAHDTALGKSLSEAMGKHPEVFSATTVHLAAAGQESGNLSEIFRRLADFLEKEYAAQQKMGTALLYPMLLGGFSLVAIAFLIVFILPSFAEMFEDMQAELPLPTRMLLGLGSFAGDYGILVAAAFLALLAAGIRCYLQERFRIRADYWLLRIPFWGELKQQTAWMQILGTLGILLEGGLRIDAAMEMVRSVTNNRYLQQVLVRWRESVIHGYPLAQSIESCPVFPPMLLELISAGESTGRLEEMLEKCAEYCSLASENLSQRLQAIVEPAMLLLLGGIVMLFVLSIVLPLLETMDHLG